MSTESPDVSRVQEELLEMLRSVGQEAAPPRRQPTGPSDAHGATTAVSPPAAVAHPTAPKVKLAKPEPGMDCPKCGSTNSWGKSSWCPDCGYYPAAGFEGSGVVEEEHVKTLREVFPPWVLPLAIGVMAVVMGAVVTRFVYPTPLQRALTALFVLGSTSLVVALVHGAAVMFVMRTDSLGYMSIINVTDTWRRVLMYSDKTRMYILLMGWGIVGVFSSLLIGLNVDLLADEMLKDMKDKPAPTIKDMIASFMRITTKALGNSKGGGMGGGGDGTDMLKDIIGGVAAGSGGMGGGGGGSGDLGDLESAMGDFSEIAEGVTDMSEGGDSSGGGLMEDGDLESSIGDLAQVGDAVTGENPSGEELPADGVAVSGSVGTEEEETGPRVMNVLDGSKQPKKTKKSTGAEALGKETIEYWVCGYTANAEGEPRSLLLAQTIGTGRLKFAMKLPLEGIPTEELEKIATQLEPFRIRNPAVACSLGGKWVNPIVICRVNHEGLSPEKRPKNPMYRELAVPAPKVSIAPKVSKK